MTHPVPNARRLAVAAVMRERAKPLVIEPVTLGAPQREEVLVDLVATGVCHTDIAMRDERPDTPTPCILGHEGAGIVAAVGAGVTNLQVGDHVVLSFMWCGRCRQCQQGRPAYCESWIRLNFGCRREDGSASASIGNDKVHDHFFGQSSFSTQSLVHERCAVKVPKSAPLELLGPLGCGVQTGAGAVLNSLRIRPGDSFACFGAGSVGLSAIMAARVAGAGVIVAVDVVEERLQLARELGATHAVNGMNSDPVLSIKELTGQCGVNYALETTGVPAVFADAVQSLSILGTCGYVASGKDPQRSFDARALLSGGKRLMGIVEGDSIPQLFIPYLLDLHLRGHLPFESMVKFYPLTEINQAFADSTSGATIKPIVRFDRNSLLAMAAT